MVSNLQPETIPPPVDIIKRPNDWMVVVDLPGADVNSIAVNAENNLLTLTAQVAAQVPEGVAPLYREYEARAYRRVFTLTEDVERQHITAVYKNGVLRISLPLAAQAKPRQISVQVEK